MAGVGNAWLPKRSVQRAIHRALHPNPQIHDQPCRDRADAPPSCGTRRECGRSPRIPVAADTEGNGAVSKAHSSPVAKGTGDPVLPFRTGPQKFRTRPWEDREKPWPGSIQQGSGQGGRILKASLTAMKCEPLVDIASACCRKRMMSSLRANRSRECAPDDRLREAIHGTSARKMDCFAALAMTGVKMVGKYAHRHSPMCNCTSWMRPWAQARNP